MPNIDIDVWYACMTGICLGAIYWMSSMPDDGQARNGVVADLLWNLAHVPVYAALAFCWLKTIVKTRPSAKAIGLAFLASAAWAVADEWHQSFVPGRVSSIGDLVLDLAGISAMLLILYRKGHSGGALESRTAGGTA
jgi:VanZ family protein